VLIRSGDLDSHQGNRQIHRPESTGELLQVQAWVGGRWGRRVVRAKRNPLPGCEQARGRSGVVEETGAKGGKEGKRNLEYRLGYRLAKKGVMKTSGWKMLTDLTWVNAVYKAGRVTVDGNAINRLSLEAARARATSGQELSWLVTINLGHSLFDCSSWIRGGLRPLAEVVKSPTCSLVLGFWKTRTHQSHCSQGSRR